MTDAELVARARNGDSAAFGELVDRHQTAVFRAALAAVGSRAEAEDAAQDAFLLAYRRLDSFRGQASFKTWLLTIAWHQAINRRRTLTRMWRRMVDRRIEGESKLEEGEAGDHVDVSPEARAAHTEFCRAVRNEIRALPSKLRDALLLATSGEHSYEEIGAMLRAPVGTVKWRVSEARRAIKQRLNARGYDNVSAR